MNYRLIGISIVLYLLNFNLAVTYTYSSKSSLSVAVTENKSLASSKTLLNFTDELKLHDKSSISTVSISSDSES